MCNRTLRQTRVRKLRTTLGLNLPLAAAQCYLLSPQDFPDCNVSTKIARWLSRPLKRDTLIRLERAEKQHSLDYLMGMKVGNFLKLCAGLGVKPSDVWEGWPR